jgi:hypothetical protein
MQMKFPEHKCGLHLAHNVHRDVYESVEGYYPDAEDFVSPEDWQKCIDTDDVWELQWYPDTPIGYHRVVGSSIELVMAEALRIEAEYKEQT